ncbi:hypothetical protein JKG47_19415 [Acidithiobacillus sp. MC6.1]|nr:hypothetical protein [Acidithiobacillus sp. MC6.1]
MTAGTIRSFAPVLDPLPGQEPLQVHLSGGHYWLIIARTPTASPVRRFRPGSPQRMA